jgi:hypothetical protein
MRKIPQATGALAGHPETEFYRLFTQLTISSLQVVTILTAATSDINTRGTAQHGRLTPTQSKD